MSSKLFNEFRTRLAVKNADAISSSYKQITKTLDKVYWDSESDVLNCRQVGSYGRHTAIDGVSDLDMLFVLPWSVHRRFDEYQHNGQSSLLSEIKAKLKARYPTTDITADGQVVVIRYKKYRVELVPVFEKEDGTYVYPNTNNGGSWETCDPVSEINALNELNGQKNKSLKRLCKMIRAWKNEHGVHMSGFLIDTLCFNFLKSTNAHDNANYGSYKYLIKDFFFYLFNLDQSKQYWLAPGSKARVEKGGNFHPKAKKAFMKCSEALDADDKEAAKKWKSIFGKMFPIPDSIALEAYAGTQSLNKPYRNTEQFIEDLHPVDIRYPLQINYSIENQGEALQWLLSRAGFKVPKQRKLQFYISQINIPAPYEVHWKVRNIGDLAKIKDQIRGQIVPDDGSSSRLETSTFEGEHYVECYIIKDEVCVARDLVEVPI